MPTEFEQLKGALTKYPILQYFEYGHLPENLKAISQPFCVLAYDMAVALPNNAETSAMLRKILEAKDCAVRAALAK